MDHFYVRRSTPISDYLIMLMPQWHFDPVRLSSYVFVATIGCAGHGPIAAVPRRTRVLMQCAIGIRGTVFNRL
ncbi:hypothetical protein [Burkholderia cenocepacia]|uniref:hypothetical protein n=1 Tax=Burkholderia cenocepacia TaxID=95486 RepID=UPI001B91B65F|nr:hypothetical protein [Burkholderia cenocepacia]MBR8099968.1 hypothetical protein [Burkholderia cenocepacia]MDI9686995.1 hypothetical protein [Burkholderia cenocepacia]HEP6430430.1 hypothetical protein [Burkholderia cenocepacia]